MSEFEQDYERRLAEARERAASQGRGDVVDYLNLRAANDAVRADGVRRLLEAFLASAGEANRAGAGIGLEHKGEHRFRVGNSWMVGPQLVLRLGVRALTVEAGWPRAPRDGIVRGGGMASARVSHFGDARAGEEFLLVAGEGGTPPRWLVLEETGARPEHDEDRVRRHVDRLVSSKR